jgi:His-Xaa-Ser system protein HxsD
MTDRTLSFDRSIAPMEAVQGAVYRLSDRLSCDISSSGENIEVVVHPGDPDADIDHLLADLRNEVLDQTLRERVRAETTDVRNLVLALAFSQTGLIEGDV